MSLVIAFRREIIDNLKKLSNYPKWSIAIEPIIVREINRGLNPIEVGNRLLYAIIDQGMKVEKHVIPPWISMMIANINIATLHHLGEDREEIISAIFQAYGAPRFYTFNDLEKKGKRGFSSLPFALVRAAEKITSGANIRLNKKEITLWNNLEEFTRFVKSILQSNKNDNKKQVFIKGIDAKDGKKLFPLMGPDVTNFFLRDIDLMVDKSSVSIKIDVNNLKCGKLSGFFFPDSVLENLLKENNNLEYQKELYLETLDIIKNTDYEVFRDIIRVSASDSLEAKNINRFFFIVGSDFCNSCLQYRYFNKSCPIFNVCFFSRIVNNLVQTEKKFFSDTVKNLLGY